MAIIQQTGHGSMWYVRESMDALLLTGVDIHDWIYQIACDFCEVHSPSTHQLRAQIDSGLEHMADSLRHHRRCFVHNTAGHRLEPTVRLERSHWKSREAGLGQCQYFLRPHLHHSALYPVCGG